jgi:hypothetical protein
LSVTRDRVTIAGICAAVAVTASQSQTIFEQLEKHFGSSPYYVVVQEIRYELAMVIIVAVLLYNARALPLVEQYSQLRDNWRLSKIGPAGHALHIEEWAVILTICAVISAFSYYSSLKALRAYQSYGLMYVSKKACEGSLRDAVERIRYLRGNHLWDKYRIDLKGAGDRYAYLDKIQDRRLSQFRSLRGRAPTEELLAQAVELQAIFGVDVRQMLGLLGMGGETGILQDWKTFIEKRSCGPSA